MYVPPGRKVTFVSGGQICLEVPVLPQWSIHHRWGNKIGGWYSEFQFCHPAYVNLWAFWPVPILWLPFFLPSYVKYNWWDKAPLAAVVQGSIRFHQSTHARSEEAREEGRKDASWEYSNREIVSVCRWENLSNRRMNNLHLCLFVLISMANQ